MYSTDPDIKLIEISNDVSLIPEIKKLLSLYGNYMFTDLKLIAGKESFYKDMEGFPTNNYQPPLGTFIAAKMEDVLVGCIGIKKFDKESFEMKRMFVRAEFRGMGIGLILCNWVIDWCRKAACKRILLDTNVEMQEAVALYYKCGFKNIDAYCINENEHPIFMELVL